MQYMMLVKASKDYEAGIPPNTQLMAGFAKLNEELAKAGLLLGAGGLLPSSHGARIHYARGKRLVTDGPFVETKELIGGFAILLAKSKAEAIEFANRAVDVHVAAGVDEVEIEIRPMLEQCNEGSPHLSANY